MAKRSNNQPLPKAVPARQPVQTKTIKNEPTKRDWFSIKYLCIILGVLSVLLYLNTLPNGFVLDDVMVLKDNTIVKQGFKGIPELFTTPHMRGYLIIPNDLYRPLSLVMFAIEYQLFGLNPMIHHLFSVLTFAGCVIMLFLFLDKFFGGKKTAIAFIGAAVFALHPIHTEVVANIKSRDELLCYFFAFWSLNLFMKYMKEGRMSLLFFGVITLFLSLISKETVIAFLAVIPLIFFFYHNDDKKRAIYITGGAVVAAAIFMIVRTAVLAKYNANQPGAAVDFIDNALAAAPTAAEKLATELYILGKYLWLMIIPYPLLVNYSFNAIPFVGFGDYQALIAIVCNGALIVVGILRFIKDHKDPWAFAIFFYFATLALFSNFPFLMGAEMAERFAFFASTGVCIAAALAVEKWVLKDDAANVLSLKSKKVLMILVPLLVVFGGMVVARNFDWKDEYTLYKTDVEKSPNDARLYQYQATAMAEDMYPEEQDSTKRKAMDAESIALLKKSLQIYPDFAEAHVELGRLLERAHMYDAAVAEDITALKQKPMNATGNNNLGSVYITLGKYRESIPYLLKAEVANPNFKFVYMNLGNSYNQLKVYDSAVTNFIKYLTFDPDNMDVKRKIGTAYFMMQKYDEAAVYFLQVAQQTPNDADAQNNVGAVYLNGKQYAKAIEQFKKAIAINPGYLNAYSNLAKTYFAAGQYEQAIDMVNRELQVNPKNGHDIPYIAMSYQKLGKMDLARKYEALAKQVYSDFKLPAQ